MRGLTIGSIKMWLESCESVADLGEFVHLLDKEYKETQREHANTERDLKDAKERIPALANVYDSAMDKLAGLLSVFLAVILLHSCAGDSLFKIAQDGGVNQGDAQRTQGPIIIYLYADASVVSDLGVEDQGTGVPCALFVDGTVACVFTSDWPAAKWDLLCEDDNDLTRSVCACYGFDTMLPDAPICNPHP